MAIRIQRPLMPPQTTDELRKAWRVLLDKFERLDRAITARHVRPEELEGRLQAMVSEGDEVTVQKVYSLGIHAPWLRSFAQYYARWAELLPGAPAQHTEDGTPVTLGEWVLMNEVAIAVQDKDVVRLDALASELSTRFPNSWVTGWASRELARFPPPMQESFALFGAVAAAYR